ncbi:MAG: hypothetical protein PHW22_04565 [Bacilli bacterium]|nr:hypothetical protein [Bacilli bacterium]
MIYFYDIIQYDINYGEEIERKRFIDYVEALVYNNKIAQEHKDLLLKRDGNLELRMLFYSCNNDVLGIEEGDYLDVDIEDCDLTYELYTSTSSLNKRVKQLIQPIDYYLVD